MIESVDFPAALLGDMSCLVMMPSISTSVEPFTVTAITTRVRGLNFPELSICWITEFFPSVNFS